MTAAGVYTEAATKTTKMSSRCQATKDDARMKQRDSNDTAQHITDKHACIYSCVRYMYNTTFTAVYVACTIQHL